MTDPYEKVDEGQPLSIGARSWNGAMEAAQDYDRRRLGTPDKGGPDVNLTPAVRVLVRNDTGGSLSMSAVLGLGDAVFDVADGPVDAGKLPTFAGEGPTAGSVIAITQAPAADREVVRAVVSGVAVVVVDLDGHTTAKFAEAVAGETGHLVRTARGPIRVLAVGGGDDDMRQCLVLLGGCCDTGKKPLGNPCLVPDAYGNVVGIAQRWEQPDGSVRCEVSGFCEGEDCGAASVPPPPGTATITGTVAVDGGFAAGRTVSLSGASSGTTRTGGGGAFSFTSVNEGSVTVTLSGLPDEVCEYSVDSGFGTPGFDAPVSVAAGSSHVVRFLVTPAP